MGHVYFYQRQEQVSPQVQWTRKNKQTRHQIVGRQGKHLELEWSGMVVFYDEHTFISALMMFRQVFHVFYTNSKYQLLVINVGFKLFITSYILN